MNTPPSSTGDESSYDSMAWELSRGHGFAVDYDTPAFRAPYDEAAKTQPELFTIRSSTPGPIAFRPPLLSTFAAGLNMLFGRQFYAVRSLNVLLMAATAGLLAWYLCREAGFATALISMVFFLIDVRSRLYARSLLTEPLACFLATLLTLTLLNVVKHTNRNRLILAGVLTGASMLTRSIVVLWLPGLTVFVCFVVRRIHKHSWRDTVGNTALFVAATLTVFAPWGIRNVMLLDRFSPMGTQGLMELSAGYSDAAWDNYGIWQNAGTQGFFEAVDTSGLTNIEAELAIAEVSSATAFEWISRNFLKLVPLAAMKIFSEFRPHDVVEFMVLVFATIGLFASSRTAALVFSVLLATNAFSVALTWSVEGRFLVPQLFILHALCAVGVCSCARGMQSTLNKTGRSPVV
ncbi:MAG: glycosyltransferase family 39 protein [Fuerstiella sp.]|nr:glycosyltransferase family 39 protein [Fuerstiella sp.]MCP4783983.1 glycosyltransferase family 39 protein [Fuerstiella sp.]MCP4857259.1 glycosyltransferase family 39 protein [Fuerstiella sp.]